MSQELEPGSFELHIHDAHYPHALMDLERPPEVLYGIGDYSVLEKPQLAIIGARRASPYGLALARIAGRIAAECRLVVVSGGARGCDYQALRSALDAGGEICIVSGCGADQVYPSSSFDIFYEAKTRRGCVISLSPWQTPPRRFAFPQRNKIIAALGHVLIICEAGKKSGTMSTAEEAAQLGRVLYAMPGSVFSPLSVGTNMLIADGASIISSTADLEARIALDFNSLRLTNAREDKVKNELLQALIANPMRVDELARSFGRDLSKLLSELSELEIQGVVEQMLDGRFSLTQTALEQLSKGGAL